jgi:uncharacterized phiE125 gp8 family phage protein
VAELKLVEGWTGPIDDVLKSNGTPLDLTGLTVELLLQRASGVAIPTAGDVVIVTPTAGVVRYTPDPQDLLAVDTPHTIRWKVTDVAGAITYFPNEAGEVWTVQPVSPVALQDNALLTMAEFKSHLKILNTDQDLLIANFINVCSDAMETFTARRLMSHTYIDEWVRVDPMLMLGLAWLDVQSPITALLSVEIAGTPQTTWMPGDPGSPDSVDVYVLDGRGGDPKHGRDRLYRTRGWTWDSLVKRTYTAGYGVPGFPVPGDLKEAILTLAEDWYYKRDRQADPVISRSSTGETVTYVNDALPRRFASLIGAYRRWS